MPIQSGDIQLLKSAVMADTAEGGGAMTGVAVVDGQSNNIFPDTSAMDRAFGRVALRKLFGVAHTSDTDTLMGTHVIITDAPDDPLVKCALFKTSGWADQRSAAQTAIERYLARGPVMSCNIYDTHYAGSRQINLITFTAAPFPEVGDAIIIVNPASAPGEQYVRITKKTVHSERIDLQEGSTVVSGTATIATLELAQTLQFDVLGPPAARTYSAIANYARVYSAAVAQGALFYGIKPLKLLANPGDLSVTVDGGIFTNLVPSATVETPLLDQRPYDTVVGTVDTALGYLALAPVALNMVPGAVLSLPSPIVPGTLALAFGSATLSDNGQGVLRSGFTAVGEVDYIAGKITVAATAPAWGAQSVQASYKPASLGRSSVSSASRKVTQANQGLSWVTVLKPLPLAGSVAVSYMAQGRWYELKDNGGGKLSGAAPEYGVGTVNYGTGSMSLTLGTLPDVDSQILIQWGQAAAASAYQPTPPTQLARRIALARAPASGVTVEWTSAGVAKTATTGASGYLSGDAQGAMQNDALVWAPSTLPDPGTSIVVSYTRTDTPLPGSHVVSNVSGHLSIQLDGTLPVVPGSFRCTLSATPWWPASTGDAHYSAYPADGFALHDVDGKIVFSDGTQVGTIDYATGLVGIGGSAYSLQVGVSTRHTGDASSWYQEYWTGGATTVPVNVGAANVTGIAYSTGADTSTTVTVSADDGWDMVLPLAWHGDTVNTDAVAFTVGAASGTAYNVHTLVARGGALYRAWNLATGSGIACGTVASNGAVHIDALPTPPGGLANVLAFKNLAADIAVQSLAEGVFRTSTAPLKSGGLTLGTADVGSIGTVDDTGTISGDFSGTVDFTRGIVKWSKGSSGITPSNLRYNAVFLQYLPLDASLLGLNNSRLPLDGKVPIFRSGDLCVVHNTQSLALANPAPRDAAISLGRERIAVLRVRDANRAVVSDTLYSVDLNLGLLSIPLASDLSAYTQPLTVEHRVEDLLVCSGADVSGKLNFTRGLTHTFALGVSYVSSALPFGDLFARAHSLFEQSTWTGVWGDEPSGATPLASFNSTDHPLVVTNRGAITERWVLIFQSSTTFIVVGESVGQIATGNVNTDCAPVNTAVSAPYFTVPALGWGSGWAAGNVLRFNTAACGAPFWVARTVLQGPASLDSDQFSIALRGDVDRP
ncbi:MAG: hypothetical protein ACT4NV_02965 [Rhodoferax sp.]